MKRKGVRKACGSVSQVFSQLRVIKAGRKSSPRMMGVFFKKTRIKRPIKRLNDCMNPVLSKSV